MGMCSCCCRCLEIMCAILLPPLGCCSVCHQFHLPLPHPFLPRLINMSLLPFLRQMEFWINVLLTILGYLPGVLYAAYVMCSVDPDRVRRRGDSDDD
ncbi:hypothetical protein ZWY2020_014201 [Hordeum vulgare]|nr:hypothetical protein ZWY2020_014201 [Hordeum vulgare]